MYHEYSVKKFRGKNKCIVKITEPFDNFGQGCWCQNHPYEQSDMDEVVKLGLVKESDGSYYLQVTGVAICSEEDTFDEKIGFDIAFHRAKQKIAHKKMKVYNTIIKNKMKLVNYWVGVFNKCKDKQEAHSHDVDEYLPR